MCCLRQDSLVDGRPAASRGNGHLSAARRGSVVAVRFTEAFIIDEMMIDEIDADVRRCVVGIEKPRLVLDFSGVEHMSSRTLTLLLNLDKHLRGGGGRLFLVHLRPELREVFVITRLDTRLCIVDDMAELRALLEGKAV